jgi:hypothetical protein
VSEPASDLGPRTSDLRLRTCGPRRRISDLRHSILFLQSSQLFVQIGEGILQQLAVPWVLTRFRLLQYPLPRETKILFLPPAGGFFGAHRRTGPRGLISGIGLLRFDGFALPTSRHGSIIFCAPPDFANVLTLRNSILRARDRPSGRRKTSFYPRPPMFQKPILPQINIHPLEFVVIMREFPGATGTSAPLRGGAQESLTFVPLKRSALGSQIIAPLGVATSGQAAFPPTSICSLFESPIELLWGCFVFDDGESPVPNSVRSPIAKHGNSMVDCC